MVTALVVFTTACTRAAPAAAARPAAQITYTPPPPLNPPVHVKVIDGAQGGLSMDDVKTVSLQALPDIVAALTSKNVDAGWLVEPLITPAQRQGLAQPVLGTGQLLPGAVGTALIMAPSFERDNREAAVRFLVAYMRGQRDYYHAMNKKDTDPGPVIQSLTMHTQVKDPSLYQVMGLPSLDPNGIMDAASWDPFQDFYIRRGILDKKVDLRPYLDTPLVTAAFDRIGRE